jgi:hypothetical protein
LITSIPSQNNTAEDIPIIEVDCDCKIIQMNKSAKIMYRSCPQSKERHTYLSDLIEAKLVSATDKTKLEYTKTELKKFMHIALSPRANKLPFSTLMHIDLDFRNLKEEGSEEDYCGRFMMSIKAVPRFNKRDKDVILGGFFLFQDNTIKKPLLKFPEPDDEHALNLGEVLMNSEGSAINKFNKKAYYVSMIRFCLNIFLLLCSTSTDLVAFNLIQSNCCM